jgi:long-chain acyl-CoA synthetase
MRGYLDRDDLTREVVTQGWFVTGDIGLVDDRGYLYLRGREREEINKGGMKIYPSDIDSVVERFEETTDVCTFAFEEPLQGEYIVDEIPRTSRGKVNRSTVAERCASLKSVDFRALMR